MICEVSKLGLQTLYVYLNEAKYLDNDLSGLIHDTDLGPFSPLQEAQTKSSPISYSDSSTNPAPIDELGWQPWTKAALQNILKPRQGNIQARASEPKPLVLKPDQFTWTRPPLSKTAEVQKDTEPLVRSPRSHQSQEEPRVRHSHEEHHIFICESCKGAYFRAMESKNH